MTGREFVRSALWLLMVLATVTAVAVLFIPVAPEDLPLALQASTSCALAGVAACLTLNLLRWFEASEDRVRARRRRDMLAFHHSYREPDMTDPRLDPATAHPLNAVDCERSAARVADIEVGLRVDSDEWFWRDKAQRRVQALEEDGKDFGLMPHEEAELEQLKAMLVAANQRLAEPKAAAPCRQCCGSGRFQSQECAACGGEGSIPPLGSAARMALDARCD